MIGIFLSICVPKIIIIDEALTKQFFASHCISIYLLLWYCVCNAAVVSMNIRPHAPTSTVHTSTSVPESVGRPLRPWVKITSNTVNGLRYSSLAAFCSNFTFTPIQFNWSLLFVTQYKLGVILKYSTYFEFLLLSFWDKTFLNPLWHTWLFKQKYYWTAVIVSKSKHEFVSIFCWNEFSCRHWVVHSWQGMCVCASLCHLECFCAHFMMIDDWVRLNVLPNTLYRSYRGQVDQPTVAVLLWWEKWLIGRSCVWIHHWHALWYIVSPCSQRLCNRTALNTLIYKDRVKWNVFVCTGQVCVVWRVSWVMWQWVQHH